jgi:hypothetical protein
MDELNNRINSKEIWLCWEIGTDPGNSYHRIFFSEEEADKYQAHRKEWWRPMVEGPNQVPERKFIKVHYDRSVSNSTE